MRGSWIKTGIATGLLTVGALPAEILYEKDGITLEGTARLVGRNAATCQVLEENETHETYEATKANHGRPLHVWRLDYSALNGSGKSLSDLRAHFQIEAEWPPCTNWTGLGQYPGPVQWAGSFETIQRPSGMRPGEEAGATTYVLGIDGREPRFGRRQLIYRFGEAAAIADEPLPSIARPPEPEPRQALAPICEGREGESECWEPLPEPPRCHVWNPGFHPDFTVTWTGACEDGVATGPGSLTWDTGDRWEYRWKLEARGSLRDGKQHGRWVERNDPYGGLIPGTDEGPYVDGERHGHWVERSDGGRRDEGSYASGLQHGRWVTYSSSGRHSYTTLWHHGEQLE